MARPVKDPERDEKIYKLRKSNPVVWSFKKIGNRYNISGEWARQIFYREERKNDQD